MEGLTAFVSKFDSNSTQDTHNLKTVPPVKSNISRERKDTYIDDSSESTVLPFSIEGILGTRIENRRRTDDLRHGEQ